MSRPEAPRESNQWQPGILTPALAQEIAGETSAIIGLNIIITDDRGYVVGSGDTSRVGSFHEASVEVLARQEAAAHNAEQARQLIGVRPGMTLPILHEGQAVGTVGITGSPGRVRRFGLVVKRQTEILLEESVLQRSRMVRERAVEMLVRDLLHFDPDFGGVEDLSGRARDLGLQLDQRRRVVVVSVGTAGARAATGVVAPSPLRIVRETFRDSRDICTTFSLGTVLVLEAVRSSRELTVADDLDALAQRIRQQLGLQATIGIGGTVADVEGFAAAYEDALAALRTGAVTQPDRQVHDSGSLRAAQLIGAVPAKLRRRVTHEVLGDLPAQADWPTARGTVIAFVESGFGLVAAAALLNIHRNTLVYRLSRVAERTGAPTTDHRAWLALYLACLADLIEPTRDAGVR